MAQGPKAKQLMMLRQQRVMRGSGEKRRDMPSREGAGRDGTND
jgi:hypothetical protein